LLPRRENKIRTALTACERSVREIHRGGPPLGVRCWSPFSLCRGSSGAYPGFDGKPNPKPCTTPRSITTNIRVDNRFERTFSDQSAHLAL
jgi:hypothetical protein